MEIQKALRDFKTKVDIEIEKYLNKVIQESSKEDRFITNALKYIKKFSLSGGKRLRPALMYYAYLGVGGKKRQEILKTSVAIELIHIFLLIHDDIIDKDFKRHNVDTVNYYYQKIGKKMFQDEEHFGNSMAIILGDMVGALGNQIIFQSKFSSDLIIKALDKLQSIVSMTVIGEAQDVYISYKKRATEKEILKMYENKTAKYSLEGPMHLGAILGGATQKDLNKISQFSLPLGIAFQIQDDILGIYGDEKKLGKPIGSDIREGKQTILLIKALKKVNSKEKKFMQSLIGKNRITLKEIRAYRQIMEKTGAKKYAQQLAQRKIDESKKIIHQLKWNLTAKNFLLGVADYMQEREI